MIKLNNLKKGDKVPRINPRAVCTFSTRLTPEYRSLLEVLASHYDCSMTLVALKAFDLLYNQEHNVFFTKDMILEKTKDSPLATLDTHMGEITSA
jgi:hypothetical protein